MNFPLNDKSFQDADPLIQDGFQLLEPNDTQGTQAFKNSRLDGYFFKNLKSGLTHYRVYPHFKQPNVGRAFTDHATISAMIPGTAGSGTTASTGGTSATKRSPSSQKPIVLQTPVPATTPAAPAAEVKASGTESGAGTTASTAASTTAEPVGGADLQPIKLTKVKRHHKPRKKVS
jgi:hypothetical protein